LSEIRDGIRRDLTTGIVQKNFKFDYELIPVGTTFQLRFELPVLAAQTNLDSAYSDESKLLQTLIQALLGLENGEIKFGRYKSKLGKTKTDSWKARRFDLSKSEGWDAYLGSSQLEPIPEGTSAYNSIFEALVYRDSLTITDARQATTFSLVLKQDGSMRLGGGIGAAKVNQLNRWNKGSHSHENIISGSSIHGAVRAYASKIVNTKAQQTLTDSELLQDLFGPLEVKKNNARASRLETREVVLQNAKRLHQTRIAIDAFTGGVVEGATFEEVVVVGGEATLTLTVRSAEPAHLGLIWFVVADILRGEVAFGGTTNLGRGRFVGQTLTIQQAGTTYSLDLTAKIEQPIADKINAWTIALDEKIKEIAQNTSKNSSEVQP
jgi:CRISPR/Cas system CSM-associated protein Csm3 (group 7 of RAMP superfamily)